METVIIQLSLSLSQRCEAKEEVEGVWGGGAERPTQIGYSFGGKNRYVC